MGAGNFKVRDPLCTPSHLVLSGRVRRAPMGDDVLRNLRGPRFPAGGFVPVSPSF